MGVEWKIANFPLCNLIWFSIVWTNCCVSNQKDISPANLVLSICKCHYLASREWSPESVPSLFPLIARYYHHHSHVYVIMTSSHFLASSSSSSTSLEICPSRSEAGGRWLLPVIFVDEILRGYYSSNNAEMGLMPFPPGQLCRASEME